MAEADIYFHTKLKGDSLDGISRALLDVFTDARRARECNLINAWVCSHMVFEHDSIPSHDVKHARGQAAV